METGSHGNRAGLHCTGGRVGPKDRLEGCRKSRLHRHSIPGPSRLQRFATPTELPSTYYLQVLLLQLQTYNIYEPSKACQPSSLSLIFHGLGIAWPSDAKIFILLFSLMLSFYMRVNVHQAYTTRYSARALRCLNQRCYQCRQC